MILQNKNVFSIIREWLNFLPISKRQYFSHSILLVDTLLILFKNSYEALVPYYISLGLIIFDLIIALIWFIDLLNKIKTNKDRIEYIKTRWYKVVGIIPLPIFRFFLLLATLKLIIITYKYIKRGEKNKELFLDREVNFSFLSLLVDAISDAIFLNSLARVEEVTRRVDFSLVSREIMKEHRSELKETIEKSLLSMKAINQLNSFPLFSGITSQLSEDITKLIVETMETEVTGKILKETNLFMLKEMDKHVRELDLDRLMSEVK